MGKGKHRAGYKEEKDGEIGKLKATIRRLTSDNKQLKSQLATYEQAFQRNITFLKGKTKDLTVEQLIAGAKKDQNLTEIEHTEEVTFKQMEEKWKCHSCNTGIMKIIIVPRHDGKWYFRHCSNQACKKRTDLKQYHDKVEGIK